MRRYTDRARLLGERARHALANPPVRVRAEAIARAPVVLLDRAGQPDVAFLDQVEHGQAAVEVLACHADHEPQVGSRSVGRARARPRSHQLVQCFVARPRQVVVVAEHALGVLAALDLLGQLDLFLGAEQRRCRRCRGSRSPRSSAGLVVGAPRAASRRGALSLFGRRRFEQARSSSASVSARLASSLPRRAVSAPQRRIPIASPAVSVHDACLPAQSGRTQLDSAQVPWSSGVLLLARLVMLPVLPGWWSAAAAAG